MSKKETIIYIKLLLERLSNLKTLNLHNKLSRNQINYTNSLIDKIEKMINQENFLTHPSYFNEESLSLIKDADVILENYLKEKIVH